MTTQINDQNLAFTETPYEPPSPAILIQIETRERARVEEAQAQAEHKCACEKATEDRVVSTQARHEKEGVDTAAAQLQRVESQQAAAAGRKKEKLARVAANEIKRQQLKENRRQQRLEQRAEQEKLRT